MKLMGRLEKKSGILWQNSCKEKGARDQMGLGREKDGKDQFADAVALNTELIWSLGRKNCW